MYKCVTNQAAIDIPCCVHHQSSLKARASHPLKFIPLQPSCDTYKYSFWPRTIIDWNSLPSNYPMPPPYLRVWMTAPPPPHPPTLIWRSGSAIACARLSDSIVETYYNEQSENKTRTTWKRGRWRRENWEREPVSISLTTLFRLFLSRLDSAVKIVNTSVSYNHSQVSRASISRDANSLCGMCGNLCLRIRYPVRASVFLALVYSNKRGR